MAYFEYKNKSIFYQETGQGRPVIFLHGNTGSSKMFEPLMPLYKDKFRCILIDFLGNGRSDRVEKFSPDMWQDQALEVISLIERLNCKEASLIGTSGGAWSAVNAALIRPDLIYKVIADSFDGRTLNDNFAKALVEERTAAKADPMARGFYEWCQGEDWEKVVDLDTEALVQCAREKRPLFCRPLSQLQSPVLFMGSREDEMCRRDLEREYREMAGEISEAEVRLFPKGGHPAIFTNAEAAAEIIINFIG